MTTGFEAPEELRGFLRETCGMLKARGFEEAAAAIREIDRQAYTTSSEWLGDIGVVVRRVRRICDLPDDLEQRLERVLGAVRSVWPES